MGVDALEHVNLRVRDLEASRTFYVDVLGLRTGPRPPFASVGYWLYIADQPVVHLVQAPPGASLVAGTGAIDHVAFRGVAYEATRDRFVSLGVPCREAVVPHDGTRQLFVNDPDGIKIELNFPP